MAFLEPQILFSLLLFALVGISLGLLGGGGSILAVPILIYVAKFSANVSIPLSLLIVGVSSFTASLSHYRQGHVNLRAAFIVGLGGILGASQGARLTHFFDQRVLICSFGGLMVFVGFLMVAKKRKIEGGDIQKQGALLLPFLTGALVGVLTGFLGVGGGFLLVPALLYVAGLPMQVAIGTSLLLITVNSISGFLSHLRLVEIPWILALAFTSLAVLGALVGTRLARELDSKLLRKIFGVFVLSLGTILFFINL